MQELVKQTVEQRIEDILSDVQDDKEINKIRNNKKELLSKIENNDIFLEIEELESQERERLMKWVYKMAINDCLDLCLDLVKEIINISLS